MIYYQPLEAAIQTKGHPMTKRLKKDTPEYFAEWETCLQIATAWSLQPHDQSLIQRLKESLENLGILGDGVGGCPTSRL